MVKKRREAGASGSERRHRNTSENPDVLEREEGDTDALYVPSDAENGIDSETKASSGTEDDDLTSDDGVEEPFHSDEESANDSQASETEENDDNKSIPRLWVAPFQKRGNSTASENTSDSKSKKGRLLQWTQDLKASKAREKPRVVFTAAANDVSAGNDNPTQDAGNASATPKEAQVMRGSDIPSQKKPYDNPDFLESDDDDDGDINRIGNVPLWWYDQHDHVGYDATGKKLARTLTDSEITQLLKDADDPDAWKTIVDRKNQRTMQLTNTDIEIIRRLRSGQFPVSTFDVYGPDSIVDFDNPDAALHPTNGAHPPKRRFLPSLSENKRINQLVQLIRSGRVRPSALKAPEVYDLWGASIFTESIDETRGRTKLPPPVPAPKMALPGHAASYNPPEEYLMSPEEEAAWKEAHPDDRELSFIPRKYSCLRRVPLYTNNLLERFERCLDLYLCPRSVKMRMNVDPKSLLPQLPDVKDLRPFPSKLALTFDSNDASGVTSLSIDRTGTYLAVGRRSGYLEVFDLSLSRRVFRWMPPVQSDNNTDAVSLTESNHVTESAAVSETHVAVEAVAFNPVYPLLTLAQGTNSYIVVLPLPAFQTPPKSADAENQQQEEEDLGPSFWSTKAAQQVLSLNQDKNLPSTEWTPLASPQEAADNAFLDDKGVIGWKISHASTVTSAAWHPKGLYCVTVCRNAAAPSQQLSLHSLTKLKTIRPIRKSAGGKIQHAAFHPTKPWLFVAYFRGIRLYSLQRTPNHTQPSDTTRSTDQQQKIGGLVKKFAGATDILSLAVHPTGDHVIVGGENRRVTWFDFDLGERPYKILRYHQAAVRSVGFHPTFPLMFSGASDGALHIFHARVYTDLMNAPAIIPVKKLVIADAFDTPVSATDAIQHAEWHPTQPWLVVGLRSGRVGLFA